jgi:hypothetical protein
LAKLLAKPPLAWPRPPGGFDASLEVDKILFGRMEAKRTNKGIIDGCED